MDSTPECQEADDVKSSLLFRVFNKQVGALRDELTEGRKSVEQAAKNKEGDLMAKEDEKQL